VAGSLNSAQTGRTQPLAGEAQSWLMDADSDGEDDVSVVAGVCVLALVQTQGSGMECDQVTGFGCLLHVQYFNRMVECAPGDDDHHGDGGGGSSVGTGEGGRREGQDTESGWADAMIEHASRCSVGENRPFPLDFDDPPCLA
jgi:hypothetical protein